MNNLLSAEWYKLRKNGAYSLICSCIAVMSVLFLTVSYLSTPKIEGYRIGHTAVELYVNSLTLNSFLMKLYLGILAGFFISAEYAAGVLKRTVSVGQGRRQIYLSKLGMFSFGIVLASLIAPLITAAAGGVMSASGLLTGLGHPGNVPAAAYLLRTLGFTVLFAAALASVAAFIAVALADSGKTIGVALLFFLFIDQVLMALAQRYAIFEKVYDLSPFKLLAQTAEFHLNGGDWLTCLFAPMAAIVVFTLLGISVFQAKEIQ
ncbi:ABC transporter permease [Cohnella sp. REN36]|uniref:ABC transporter permease n=1 Tax=Cohnella sp. REN36 TaxID=2887347 RepID=UPI001D13B897|nr:ABC transporter permease [Cohnella sp. REN36]MCC3372333.1 ABC transporter permease [Cohnella sp. REN36]